MTSSASVDDFTCFRIRGAVITAVPPGRDPQPVSGQGRPLACPKVIRGWRHETGRG